MATQTIYLSDAELAQLRLESRLGGQSVGTYCADGARLFLGVLAGAPPPTAASRVLGALRCDEGRSAESVAIDAGLTHEVVHETLFNLARMYANDAARRERRGIVRCVSEPDKPLVWYADRGQAAAKNAA
jgi:hypothetical protein